MAHLVSALPGLNHANGVLPKGSSAGLACRSLSSAYSLRHIGTRLNRVKAKLRAATEAALNARKLAASDASQNSNVMRNRRPNASVQSPKLCVTVKRTSSCRTVRPISTTRSRRSTMWLRSAPADESKQPTDSASSPSSSLSRKTHGGSPEKTVTRDITLEPPEQSKQIELLSQEGRITMRHNSVYLVS
ncbi:unnamed protein product [Echinostoma caproni]|uniref:Uncharacterized protein n=1 Tax=Echinostoma caproni TaxID=27848 RepID=A0A183B8R1_9TREM|nr:unnamed protein product [Echinostoma caproni]